MPPHSWTKWIMRPSRSIEAVRWLGLRWTLWRVGYALRSRLGLRKRRFPCCEPDGMGLGPFLVDGVPKSDEAFKTHHAKARGRFFFEPDPLPPAEVLREIATAAGVESTLRTADAFCHGRFLYYSRQTRDLGWPPAWLTHPDTGYRHSARTHWCDYATFAENAGDIKDVWEPSRFACAFWLVRAYALTSDTKYAESFWALFESWCEQNPPNMGPNWLCGQEAALRAMAWCFALHGFWDAEATTPARVAAMAKMLSIHADRIEANIGYAVSQHNNHALSEAVGLWTIAILFPELRGAARWSAIARRILRREVPRQIYDDGSYVQHSTNYHRVMLHVLLWIRRLTELNDQPLDAEITHRIDAAGEFLRGLSDGLSGRTPNYGANDGALPLPLSSCAYIDFRPTVQAACYAARRQRAFEAGPWDELLVWIHGADALNRPTAPLAPPASDRFDAGGYYTLRGTTSWCAVRCHTYRDRPAHEDMLHLDLWSRGVNVLGDSGTFRYFAPAEPVLERYFKSIAAHNTVELDGEGPLTLASRFLWIPWPKARCLIHQANRWQGEHHAYAGPPWHVIHRRSVQLEGDAVWRITDELLGKGLHEVRLRWHLADGDVRVDANTLTFRLDYEAGTAVIGIDAPADTHVRVHRGLNVETRALGWRSDHYAEREPRPTLEAVGRYALPATIVTRVRLTDR